MNDCRALSAAGSLGSRQWEVHFPTDSLGCKAHCSYYWQKKKRNNKNKIPGELWSDWAQWQVPLLKSGFSECHEARSLSSISEQETMKMTQHEQKNRWEMCCAKRLRGGRQVPGPSLKTNSLSREGGMLYPTTVLFIALIGIVFPWKGMKCQGVQLGLVSWSSHCSVPPS